MIKIETMADGVMLGSGVHDGAAGQEGLEIEPDMAFGGSLAAAKLFLIGALAFFPAITQASSVSLPFSEHFDDTSRGPWTVCGAGTWTDHGSNFAYSASGTGVIAASVQVPDLGGTHTVGFTVQETIKINSSGPGKGIEIDVGGPPANVAFDNFSIVRGGSLPPAPLSPPPVTSDAPGPGKRVRVTPPEYSGTDVHYTLYLPPDWRAGGTYPVIVEFVPNTYQGIAGTVENTQLGFYQSAGSNFIWVTMPSINYQSSPMSNALTWWGDGNAVDPTGQAQCAQFVQTNLVRILENYGGDPSSVFITGFSRGAIATGYIGLSSDALADVWLGFLPYSQADGGSFTPDPHLVRTSRIKGRASFITYGQLDSGAPNSKILLTHLMSLGFPVEAYELAGWGHTDGWITDRNTPVTSSASSTTNVADVRARMRAWIQEVIASKPGTHSISGVVIDPAGKPIQGVRLQSGATHWTFTDANGNYQLAGLVDGVRSLTVSCPSTFGFATNTVNVLLNGANLINQNFVWSTIRVNRSLATPAAGSSSILSCPRK